jgi:hypothetical protein
VGRPRSRSEGQIQNRHMRVAKTNCVCLFVFVPSILSFFLLVFVFYIFLSLCFIIALCSFLTSLSFSHLVLVFLLPSPSHFRNYAVFHKLLFHSHSLHLGLYIPHIADAEGVV